MIEARILYKDRLRSAVNLLEEAAKDVESHDNPAWSNKERGVAVEHVRRAERYVREAIGDRAAEAPAAPPPPPPAPAAHPAFATAMGNLRHARALLERPAGAAD